MRLRILSISLLAVLPALAFGAAKPSGPTTAPAFTLPARGGTACLDSLRGRVVLVDFWASWCQPCRRSFAWMNTMIERYGRKGLSIVAVNLDKDRDAADRFLATNPASFTVAFDPAGKTAEAFHVSAMPMSFLVSRDGVILHSKAGFDPRKTGPLETMIEEKLKP
jgi:thiol-disulfide isomerase/thioredoxin